MVASKATSKTRHFNTDNNSRPIFNNIILVFLPPCRLGKNKWFYWPSKLQNIKQVTLFWTWQYLELSHDYQLPRECSFNVRETSVKTLQLMFCFKGVLYLKEAEGLSAQQGSPLKDKSNFLFKSNQKVAWLLCLDAWFKKRESPVALCVFPSYLAASDKHCRR